MFASRFNLSRPLPTVRHHGQPAAFRMPRRGMVNKAVFGLLMQTKLGQVAVASYRMQDPGLCRLHTPELMDTVRNGLMEAHELQQTELPASATRTGLWQMVFGEAVAQRPCASEESPSAERLAELTLNHGPVMLTMNGLLPRQSSYVGFHCAVLLCSFEHEGHRIGMVLDGNDLQDNPAIAAVCDDMAREGDTRALSELSADDFERINQRLSQSDTGLLDVRQMGIRFIDLEQLVSVSPKRHDALGGSAFGIRHVTPNSVDYRKDLAASPNLLPDEVVSELRSLIAKDPDIVERLD